MSHIFHDGQLAVQSITGEKEIAKMRIPMIKDAIHPRSIPFIEYQLLAFPGSEDIDGNIWLSLIVGKRGFIKIPSIHEINFDLSKVISNKNDVFFKNIETKPTTGMLFHDAERRARYRVWGTAQKKENQLVFNIKMGYPSCPKHIQREVFKSPKVKDNLNVISKRGSILNSSEKKWIASAHTFFIATQTKKGDIESSHRGGNPGFIKILESGLLRVPDYLGNSMFSTLGNIYENQKAALLFVDYTKGITLQLTGKATLQFDQNSEEDLHQSGETGRFWTFETKQWIKTENHHQIDTAFVDFSPFNVKS